MGTALNLSSISRQSGSGTTTFKVLTPIDDACRPATETRSETYEPSVETVGSTQRSSQADKGSRHAHIVSKTLAGGRRRSVTLRPQNKTSVGKSEASGVRTGRQR